MKKNVFSFFIFLLATFFMIVPVFADTHKVSFNYNGVSESVEVEDGDVVTPIEEPKKEGYTFFRWKDNKTQEAYDFTKPVTEDITLAAQWKKTEKTDMGKIVEGKRDQSDITGVNPGEEFDLIEEKQPINFLKRIDIVSIGILVFGLVIVIVFVILYKKEKKSGKDKIIKEKQIIGTGKCHRCGTPYKDTDKKCNKCGAIIFRT